MRERIEQTIYLFLFFNIDKNEKKIAIPHDCSFYFITGRALCRMPRRNSWPLGFSFSATAELFDGLICCRLTTRVDPIDGWIQGFVKLCAGHSALTSISRLIFATASQTRPRTSRDRRLKHFSYNNWVRKHWSWLIETGRNGTRAKLIETELNWTQNWSDLSVRRKQDLV